jgi:hypothetical protein
MAVLSITTIGSEAELDPLTAYDDLILAAVVIEKCQLHVEGKESNQKIHSIHRMAAAKILNNLNEDAPERSIENARKADFLIKRELKN